MGTSLQEVKVITCTTSEGLVKKDPTHLRRKCKRKHLPQHACSHILHFWRIELQSESSRIFAHTGMDNERRRRKRFYRRVSRPCNLLPLYPHGTSLIPDWSLARGRSSCINIYNASVSCAIKTFFFYKKKEKTFKRTELRRSNKLLKSHSHAHKTHAHSCELTPGLLAINIHYDVLCHPPWVWPQNYRAQSVFPESTRE